MGLLLGASVMTVAEMIELCLELIPGCRRVRKHRRKHRHAGGSSGGGALSRDAVPERVVVTE